jgi:3-oxoacyl-[acyl-carrier protein] reductase
MFYDPAGRANRECTMAKALDGRVALVTGAGKNIGRAIALLLARDGATVVVNGRSDEAAIAAVAAEIEAAGGRALPLLADVADEAAVARMVAQATEAFGGIDIAVSNAGLRRQTPFLQISLAEWREIMSVALDGSFILARAVVPSMAARGGGAIIGLSGISTHLGTPNRAHVSASKSGLEGLLRALAVELAPHGIRCNAVAPGSIDTARGAAAGPLPATHSDATIPLRRKGNVEEIAAVVRMLAGPEGGYITGQTIHVNGGAFLT